MDIKCENCCSDKSKCEIIIKRFKCVHFQCALTTAIVGYCIMCGNNEFNEEYLNKISSIIYNGEEIQGEEEFQENKNQ